MYDRFIENLTSRLESSTLKTMVLRFLSEHQDLDNFLGPTKLDTLRLEWKFVFGDQAITKHGINISLLLKGTKLVSQWENHQYASDYFDKKRLGRPDTGLEYPKKVVKEIPNQILCTLIGVELAPYPVCCGLYQANNFHYYDLFGNQQEEITSSLMDMITKTFRYSVSQLATRLFFIFVESASERRAHLRDISETKGDGYTTRSLYKIPEESDETVKIQYPHIYNWARKQADYSELLQYNANSSNILHMASVVSKD